MKMLAVMVRSIMLGLLFLLLNLLHFSSFGSVTGSDMGWTCLGGDSFLVKVNVYNDCNGAAPGSINVTFRCQSTGTIITTLSLSSPTPVDITPYCATACSRCQSSTCSFPYGINKYTYQGVVKLSAAGSCCNILLSAAIGNRSSAITTGAAGAGYYNEAMMNRCQSPCDNSPVFTNNPVQILCNGQDVTFSHGLVDLDTSTAGALTDSITYEWAQPQSDYNTNISYTGSYTYNKPIYFWGFPSDALPYPRGIRLDAKTGEITFRPMKTESTVMVVKANVFRNGTKIAELKRDLEIIVINCALNYPPIISTSNGIRTKTVCEGQTVSFSFTTADPNTSDTVSLNWNNAIPGATWTSNSGSSKTPTATLSWKPDFTKASNLPYTFTVTARDNACPLRSTITQVYQIIVKPSPEGYATTVDSGCGTYWFTGHQTVGSNPAYSWSSPFFNFSSATGNQVWHTFLPSQYPYTMGISSGGCTTSYFYIHTQDTYMVATLPSDTTVCLGSNINIYAVITDAKLPYTLQWGSGKTVFAGKTAPLLNITITRDTTIWIRGSYSTFHCAYDEIKIRVQRTPLHLPVDTFFCRLGYLVTPVDQSNQGAFSSFKWFKQGSPTVVDSDAWLNTYDTGAFICQVVDTLGCSFSDIVNIHTNPVVVASSKDTSICFGDQAILIADSFAGHSYLYKWQLNGNLISTSRQIIVQPSDTTTYNLIATEYLNGKYCSAVDKVNVNVKPLPVIAFQRFDYACEDGPSLMLDSFVRVDGNITTSGLWACTDNPALVSANNFVATSAVTKINPGYKLSYGYTSPVTSCFNSDTAYLDVYPKPATPEVDITGDTSLCYGEFVTLSSKTNYFSYAWTNGARVKTIIVNTTGSYRLAGLSFYGCASDSTAAVNVVMHPIPDTPVVSVNSTDSMMECDLMPGTYDWYYRAANENTYTLIPLDARRINPKNYCNQCFFRVVFTDAYGCVSPSSALYYFINLGIDDAVNTDDFTFYPNPANKQFFIENTKLKPANLTISDIYGRSMGTHKILQGKNTLDISKLRPGVYVLKFNDSNVYRLVVE